jgi:hypothetical protein
LTLIETIQVDLFTLFERRPTVALDVSKQVANHIATARTVLSSVEHHGPIVIGPLEQELKKYVPVATNFSELFQGLSTYLNEVTQNMQNADIALAQERADDPQYREKRDNAVQELTKTISRVKEILPDSHLSQYGLDGTPPSSPDGLINYGLKIIGLLKEKPELLNPPEYSFIQFNVDFVIEYLTACINNLSESLIDVKREEREAQATLENRDQKIAEWKSAYVGVASILAGFYQLAGRIDLADRIRPTVRKTSGAGKETEPVTEPVVENEESPA